MRRMAGDYNSRCYTYRRPLNMEGVESWCGYALRLEELFFYTRLKAGSMVVLILTYWPTTSFQAFIYTLSQAIGYFSKITPTCHVARQLKDGLRKKVLM